MEFLARLFSPAGFPARWQCGSGWSETPWLGWLHIVSDLGVWGAYVAIPLVLAYFLFRRQDLPFRTIFLLFGAFILACGTTHLMEAIIFYWPAYRLAGMIKLFTAVVSWATVFSLFGVVPNVLAMRSPEELEREIKARQQAEQALQQANAELERRVAQRTTDLAQQDEQLRVTVAALQQSEQALKETDRKKDEFLATLAHELRNPLAPIRNSLEVMKRADNNPEVIAQSRGTMERQMSQMVRLVDDLLDVSRISRNRLALRRESVSVADIVNNAVEACQPQIDSARHELKIDLPAQPIHVHADSARLVQVLGNLLTNACKYTEPGGRIAISVRRGDGDVLIRVRDNGIGIPPELMPRAFEMFSQLDRTLDRAQGGLGIGLTLVKRLVEMHEGTVTAHSEGTNQGTEFTVRLPALAAGPQPRPPVDTELTTKKGRRKILVVDDNRDSAITLAMLLKITGNELQTAHDGQEAVTKAEQFQPEIILLDIGMPIMDGYQACRAIRTQPWGQRIKIVALTGWGQESDRRQTREAGFDAHLVKPVEHALLVKTIDDLLPSTA
ncbi:hybrid sensor histidine kinase/response regulator [Anatilimnocola floriformis]|uniref:hybrid sensor histidine kinase/response regulator n=1 Tax=Anatilimnocola floriformis TaxID=2948575 RepID=UPI0020C4B52D|nr:ATP-binding protein [Anatilimnocola floriformis]